VDRYNAMVIWHRRCVHRRQPGS